jgi:tRNA U34 5-methylaminomethyl-2-thiouridine-forming methyltransferase MnmC
LPAVVHLFQEKIVTMLRIIETQDGSHSLFSEEYGVSYHSKYGAIKESMHVFIEAGLFYKAIQKKQLRILEMGFGTGLNAFLTFLEAQRLGLEIHYTGVEAYPVPDELTNQLNYPAVLGEGKRRDIFQRIHRSDWSEPVSLSPEFTFEKQLLPFDGLKLKPHFDLIYFDAFAPSAQPELWESLSMQKMYDALLPGGLLVTYCAKGTFKRTLLNLGFEVEALKGPPGKREMTRAKKLS